MASNVEAPERWYLALLGFAEHFRTSSPPKIRLCVHCLQAVFQFKPPQRIEARTHLQLGSVLYHHTKNSDLARSHLEKAVSRLNELGKSGDAAAEPAGVGHTLGKQRNTEDLFFKRFVYICQFVAL